MPSASQQTEDKILLLNGELAELTSNTRLNTKPLLWEHVIFARYIWISTLTKGSTVFLVNYILSYLSNHTAEWGSTIHLKWKTYWYYTRQFLLKWINYRDICLDEFCVFMTTRVPISHIMGGCAQQTLFLFQQTVTMDIRTLLGRSIKHVGFKHTANKTWLTAKSKKYIYVLKRVCTRWELIYIIKSATIATCSQRQWNIFFLCLLVNVTSGKIHVHYQK